ncbi:MAG: OmpA family protein [Alphaproteobacteria bacterium]|nr:OmpA family protein [Alphaproteobacteria bacterium]
MKKIFKSSRNALVLLAIVTGLFACVSKKKFNEKVKEDEAKYNQLNGAYLDLLKKQKECDSLSSLKDLKATSLNDANKVLQDRINQLMKEIDLLKQNNNLAVDQLKNLSVISKEQSESIKKSLENIGAKDLFIQNLQQSIAHKDSLNLALVMNLKGAIGDLNDDDIQIKIEKDVVFIDISDKLLFKIGSYDLSSEAKKVLGKIAKVLIAQPEIEFMVEGHTDSLKQHRTSQLVDNWDLSVKRATSVVRVLQNEYGINPARITAAGRSQYKPIDTNATDEGRARNRRTRIVILPQLDQFFNLLENKQQ